jgi:hypothetical protein
MSRGRRLALLAAVAVVFIGLSAVLARVWSADGAERSAIGDLIGAEARGDTAGMVERIAGCRTRPDCQALVAQDAAALRLPGSVAILQLQPSTGFTLGGATGVARVAWKSGDSKPVVQCVRVRRTGTALSGLRIELLAISRRIKSDADCPTAF